MSDEPNKEDRLDRDYRRGRTWLEWLKAVAVFLACVALLFIIWAMYALRNSSNMTAKVNSNVNELLVNAAGAVDSLNDFIRKGNEKLAAIDATKINTAMDSGNAILVETKKRIHDLEPVENQAAGAIADVRTQSRVLLGRVGGAVDELHAQTRQEGDALAKTINGATDVEARLGTEVTHLGTIAQTQSEALVEVVKAVTARVNDKRVTDFMDTLPKTGGNVEQITAKLAGIAGNLETASAQAPQIAVLWRRAMETNNRFQKYLIVARIVGLVAPAFGPLLP